MQKNSSFVRDIKTLVTETIIVTKKEALSEYCNDICALFEACFSVPMRVELWKWAYLDNIFGNPIVSMTFAHGKLVGHYAVIPINLVNKQNEHLKSALSMTTMVAKSHREHYLFTALAEQTYAEMQKQNYDIVYGFPNKMSAPGFRKRLGWELGETDYVAFVTKEQLLMSMDLKTFLASNKKYGFDIQNSERVTWRTSKPDCDYRIETNNIVKKYEDNLDLMYLDEECIMAMDANKKYNILLDASVRDLRGFKVFDYQFGYRKFTDHLDALTFDKSMLMSDIF